MDQNPTTEEFMMVSQQGEVATYPYISRIKANCMVEITLDKYGYNSLLLYDTDLLLQDMSIILFYSVVPHPIFRLL